MIKRLSRHYGIHWQPYRGDFVSGGLNKKMVLFTWLLNAMVKQFKCEVYWGTLYYRIVYDPSSNASVSGTDA